MFFKFIYKILEFPVVYDFYQSLVTAKNASTTLFKNFIDTSEDFIVLDCGCGTSKYRELIDAKKYIGLDFNSSYIEEARSKFPNDTFKVADLTNLQTIDYEKVDRIILLGIIHHLDNNESMVLLDKLYSLLTENGVIYTLDPLFVSIEKTSDRIANFIASKDRGQYVREEKEYLKLFSYKIEKIEKTVFNNLLRIPFYHLGLSISK